MLSVLEDKKEGFRFHYVLSDGENKYGGGLGEDGFLCVDALCPFKELMLRTLINKCVNEFVQKVCAKDVWDTDLVRFGFERQGDVFVSSFETLRLPHDCGGHA